MSDAQIRARFDIRYGAFELNVDLAIPVRGVTALFGPSGSGKTTILRALTGIERFKGAYLSVNQHVWQDDVQGIFLPTYKRPLGYVFQEASLFAHLNVRGNLEFGMRRVPAAERRVSLDQAVELLDIAHLMDRKPDRLSGGERQRVAIARALATSPRLLLMDEPLAALDPRRKEEIMPYLQRLHDELEIPVIYVSHSPDEVARLADHLILLENGKVVASGAAADLLTRLDLPLAHGDAASALVTATIVEQDEVFHLMRAEFSGGSLQLTQQHARIGQTVRIRVQARDVSLTLAPQQGTSVLNSVPAIVTDILEEATGQAMIGLDANGTRLLSRITRKSVAAMQLQIGSRVYAQIKGVAILK
ncbi:molybdenum ABC transporter ATP-binding protein [uncultured Oxalicibacterium sp.]|uniref:molybdenum ABC transporter ATP-binding protein n=1 Tax=uncultured Oxalicibacterium sp. TaxID=1168540 RepID=UPI0025CD296F|nr:molybdenum ABC transporter ATP-binding protein [uncultured Oxalicibacterium sp.]